MSAFGTCGLSLGVTDDISGLTKSNTNDINVYRSCWFNFIYYYDSWT